MANREITYYSLLSCTNLRHIESVADEMDEKAFFELGFEDKWFSHLWIDANNEAFLEYISFQTDLNKLDMILREQIKLYAKKQGEGYEQNKGDFYKTYKARKDWLNQTIFICKNEYNKTQKEVFNEICIWCIDWQNKWLETFNPYSQPNKIHISNPLKLIDAEILQLFIEAEKKATNNTLKFSSEIRCAAFCEQLFIRNYFTTKFNGKKQDRTIQKQFAFSRYGMDIKTGFASKNKVERNKHVTNKVDGLLPLRNCF